MKRVFDHLRDRIHHECCVPPLPGVTLDELRLSEWSPEFEKMMRNRLVMGAMRYGRFGTPEKSGYDYIGSIIEKAKAYMATGNDELLVDIANLALVEFVEGSHPLKHFEAADDKGHVKAR